MFPKVEAIFSRFHDGHLLGLTVGRERTCSVFLSDRDDVRYDLQLSGVERLHVEDFREGNIILDVTVATGPEIRLEDLLFPLGMNEIGRHVAFVEGMLKQIHEGALFLVEVNPSYGAVFACLCKKWSLEETREEGGVKDPHPLDFAPKPPQAF